MGIINKFKRNVSWKRIRNNIKYLLKNDLYEKEFQIKDEAVEDCIYEFDEAKKVLPVLKILSSEETISVLNDNPKSFARFGDGEIRLIEGEDSPFQSYDPDLARKMMNILSQRRDDLYVGLNRSYFETPFSFSERNHEFYRIYGTSLRRFFLSMCDPENTYLDACCFGGYFRLPDDYDFEALYERNKNLFKDKKIALVAGDGILEKLKYDVFEYAKEKVIITAPSKNAFSQYNDIITQIEERVDSSYFICMILGMTATALAADLTDKGYIAWDIGHIAKDYDTYMKKVERTPENMKRFWDPD